MWFIEVVDVVDRGGWFTRIPLEQRPRLSMSNQSGSEGLLPVEDSMALRRIKHQEVGKSKLFGDVDKSDRCWMLDLYVCVRVWLARFGLRFRGSPPC
jgi:hypothetical protein